MLFRKKAPQKSSFSGFEIIEFDTLPSTNEYCKTAALCDRSIVLAHKQTSGHGRMGRNFVSEDGGLYVSFFLEPRDIAPEALIPLTGRCAVAVFSAIRKVCRVTPDIKWTNDLLLFGKKICGILAETVWGENGKPEKLIIGIGINLNQTPGSFKGDLSSIASSIFALTGIKTDIYKLLLALAEEISDVYSSLSDKEKEDEYLDIYRAHCKTLGKEVHILCPSLAKGEDPREVFKKDPDIFPVATALDIDRDFGLIVRYEDGTTETLRSGEVSVR